MNRTFRSIVSASAVSLLASTALAEDTTYRKADRVDSAHPGNDHLPALRLSGAAKASDVIGMTVKNYQDETLGSVEDLAVEVESGRIVQVIVSTGGFLGLGETFSAVPPGALHHDVARKVLHLDASAETLKSAPKCELSQWTEGSDSAHVSAVYRHHDQAPAFRYVHRGDEILNPPRQAVGTPAAAQLPGGRESMIPESRPSQLPKASSLMGMAVKNLQGEKLGEVDNLLLDLAAGRVVSFIVSTGGFLGMGDELSAVPPAALRFSAHRGSLQLDTTKESLSRAPHFKSGEWPDFTQPSYAAGVYRAYGVEPYFTTNLTAEAANPAPSLRDRSRQPLTPLNQGSSPADVETTAQIRKGILAGRDMSVNARNVKIVTNKGQVTLRGPVNSTEEKRLIGLIANDVALFGNVDNQLEVK